MSAAVALRPETLLEEPHHGRQAIAEVVQTDPEPLPPIDDIAREARGCVCSCHFRVT